MDSIYRKSLGFPVTDRQLMRERDSYGVGARQKEPDFDGYDTETGSDLMIHMQNEELPDNDLAFVNEQIVSLEASLVDPEASTEISQQDIIPLMHQVEGAVAQYEARLDALSETDKLFAQATQDWVLQELARREKQRGYAHPQATEAAYSETIDVLGELIAELNSEDEDPALLELANVWRMETVAELNLEQIKRLYDLAA